MSDDSARLGPLPHSQQIEGRVALVTGGALRVGRAICSELSQAGLRLVIHCHRSRAAAEALAAALPGEALVVAADLRRRDETEALFAQVLGTMGRLDYLVNNASIFARTPFATMTEEAWAEQIEVNLTAPQRCARLALPLGVSGIVNVVDVAAWQPWREYAAYGVAKAGLLHLTRILARELSPAVRVNAVAPGTVLFPDDYSEEQRAAVLRRVPLGCVGSPEDIARAVHYLLREPYVTGVCLPIDGGAG